MQSKKLEIFHCTSDYKILIITYANVKNIYIIKFNRFEKFEAISHLIYNAHTYTHVHVFA